MRPRRTADYGQPAGAFLGAGPDACRGGSGLRCDRTPKWRNWQTRRTQNPVPLGECGVDSHLRHSRVTSSRAKRAICRWRDESGQAIVLSAVWMLVLLGMAGLVIDVGSWERVHRHLQSA